MLELTTYRYVVLNMVRENSRLSFEVDADKIPCDEHVEFFIRRYWMNKESARNCMNALIANF